MKKQLFQRNFMWYYTTIWLVFGATYNLLDFISYGDADAFWAIAIATPTILWLFKSSE